MGIVTEEWRAIEENPYYEVSNTGKVKSLARTLMRRNGRSYRTKERTLAISSLPKGYRFVSLYDEQGSRQFYVHRLVASAFIGPCPDGCEVNHKDGYKSNNRDSNLEYVTHLENMTHAADSGLIQRDGDASPTAKYSEEQIRRGYSLAAAGFPYKEAAARAGVSQCALESACRGNNWKSLGLTPLRRAPLLNKGAG